MTTPKIEIGTKLYEVFSGNSRKRAPRYIVVTRIGRRWAYYGEQGWREDRFDKNTLRGDYGDCNSGSKMYFTKEEHDEEVAKNTIWTQFTCDIQYGRPPEHLSSKELQEIINTIKEKPDAEKT